MAKLGWVCFAVAGALLVGGAVVTKGSGDDPVVQRLDELIKLQRLDVHRRYYEHHALFAKKCDFGRECKGMELSGRLHELEHFKHEYDEACENTQACKERDARAEKLRADYLKRAAEERNK